MGGKSRSAAKGDIAGAARSLGNHLEGIVHAPALQPAGVAPFDIAGRGDPKRIPTRGEASAQVDEVALSGAQEAGHAQDITPRGRRKPNRIADG